MNYLKYLYNNYKLGVIIISSLFFSFYASAQPNGETCIDSNPFCAGSPTNFPNNPMVNNAPFNASPPLPNTSPSGPNYGCLGSQPRPIWYHMQIETGGNLKITMKQTTGANGTGGTLDLDFALWGPFNNLSTGCQQVMNGSSPIQCSFSASSTENLGLGVVGGAGSGQSTPPATQAGEYYIILLTNYSQSNGYIDFNQTGGSATTNCLILTPCSITYPTPLCKTSTSQTVTQTGSSSGVYSSTAGLTINTTNGTIDPSTSTPGQYTVTYTVAASGSTTACESNAIVTIVDIKTPAFTPIGPICAGTPLTLPTTSLNGVTGTWAPAVNNTATTTYTFTPGANQCTVPALTTMTVVVKPLPIVSAGPDSLICEGTQFIFNATGADSYAWNNGVVNGTPFSPTATATYTVTGTTNGCSVTDQMTLSITPLPIISFTPDKVTGCLPLEVNFLDNNAGGNSYLWTFGNGLTQTTGPQATTIYNAPGCYDVNLQLTTPNGCVNNVTYDSLICLNPQPVSSFTTNPNILTQLDSYSNMNNLSIGATMYKWNFGDGSPINTQFAPSHQFPDAIAGFYEISLIAISEDGCKDTSKVIIEVLDELVYYVPNAFTPDGDELNPTFKPIFTSGFEPLSYRMVIYNRWGEMVFESLNPQFGWDGTFTASEGRVQEGSYTWKIEFKTTLSDARKVIMGHVTVLR